MQSQGLQAKLNKVYLRSHSSSGELFGLLQGIILGVRTKLIGTTLVNPSFQSKAPGLRVENSGHCNGLNSLFSTISTINGRFN